MKYLLLFLVIVVSNLLLAQNTVLSKIPLIGKNIHAFIPKGYDTIETAKGDLNKDGVEDLVIALYHPSEDTFEMDKEPVRLLVVLLKQKEGYRLGGKSAAALMCRHCGGVMGEPFNGIWIDNGVLIIHHYAGSAWRWVENRKFRYQNGGMYLIGSTSDYFWNVTDCNGIGVGEAGRKYRDVNWVTGDEEVIVKDEDCKLLRHTKKKLKKKPLVKLEYFKYDF